MKAIRIDTGLKEYPLIRVEADANGNEKEVVAAVVAFNPTDMEFVNAIFNAFEKLDEIHSSAKERIDNSASTAEFFEITRGLDTEMRNIINGIFGTDICTPLFGTISVYAASDGLPLWANFMFSLMDELDEAFTEERKKTNPRIQKYTAKYSRK